MVTPRMAPPAPPPYFTAAQWRVISTALVLLAVGATVVLLALACAVLGRFVTFFADILWPLAAAGVLALVLRPAVAVLQQRLHLQRSAAVVLLFGFFLLLCAASFLVVIPPAFVQLLDFIDYAPTLWARGHAYIAEHYPQWLEFIRPQLANPTVHQAAETALAEGKAMLLHLIPSLRSAGGGLLGFFAFGANLALIPVYLFYFLLVRGTTGEKLAPNLTFLSPGVRADVVFLVHEFFGILEAFFRGQLLVGVIMGVLLALGFTLIGLKFALILGLLIGLLNIVRFLGTILGLLLTLPVALLQPDGGWHLFGLVVIVTMVVQVIEGSLLTPKIVMSKSGLHPVTITVALLFWGTALGSVVGTVLAIPLTAFFVTAWRLARQKYFPSPA
jgi:predicted PurR-regulated permease PerM